MKRIAIVGAGISGLTAAYYLSRNHQVTVFERAGRIGGHTNTIVVDSSIGPLPVDTGFIVHNRVTYPNFCRLLEELGVATQPSDMSFAVTTGGRAGAAGSAFAREFEYSSGGLPGFFAQKSNLFRPGHYRLLREILRFNRTAPRLLDQPDLGEQTLGDYLDSERYSAEFTDRYLFPMASAIWSCPPERMRTFPAHTLIRFFVNHGLLAVANHPTWRTIRGGSHAYLGPLTRPFRDRIRTGATITRVLRQDGRVHIDYRLGESQERSQTFDEVVFACHGNQILPLLADPRPLEIGVLSAFETSRNEAVLHTDTSLLPRRPRARASWNYLLGEDRRVTVTYDMNRLQSLACPERYCVTLNPYGRVDERKVIRRMVYWHPIFSQAALRSQRRWAEISGRNHTHFCGAYWRYGFHEDGVVSALRVVEAIEKQTAWDKARASDVFARSIPA